MTHRDRDTRIDAAKGIGIITVIAGHIFWGEGLVCLTVFTFHMPLFFFISGVFYRDTGLSAKQYIIQRARVRLWPVVLACLVLFPISMLVPVWRQNFSIPNVFRDLYLGVPSLSLLDPAWFMFSLFEIEVSFYFYQKYKEEHEERLFVLLALLALPVFTVLVAEKVDPYLPYGRMPWRLDSSIMGFVFFALGYWSRAEILGGQGANRKWRPGVAILGAAGIALAVRLNGSVNISALAFGDVFLYLFGSLSGIVVVLLLGIPAARSRWLNLLGRHTLFILLTHNLVLRFYALISSYMTKEPYHLRSLLSQWWALGGTVLTVFVMSLCCLVIERMQAAKANLEQSE